MRRLGLLAMLVLSGCAPTPVLLRYEPNFPTARISLREKPSVYVAPVEDRAEGPRMLGKGGRGKQTVMANSARDAVREALVTELTRLTFSVVNVQSAADATLKAVLKRLDAEWDVGGDVPVEGRLALDLTLVGKDGAVLWADVITGKGRSVIMGANVPGKGPDKALNGALANAMFQLGPSLAEGFGVAQVPADAPSAAAVAPVPAPAIKPALVSSDVDVPPSTGRKSRGHAVIVGIERYRAKLPRADFAAADAALVGKYAHRVFGYPEENIAVLTDDGATKGDFEKYFERWLPNRVEKDDEVFVYFSGHGAPNAKTGDAYLVPYDGDPTYLAETGYSLKKLYAALAKLPTKKITVTLDSCFSGAGGRSVLAKGARPLVTVQTAAEPAGMAVLAASAGDQISNTYDEKGHGLFTYFLLKGLKENGADLRAAFDYAKPEVSKVARREYNADQEPQWRESR